jgi:hypothetical protein
MRSWEKGAKDFVFSSGKEADLEDQPSFRDGGRLNHYPGDKSPGYYRMSLRDMASHRGA